MDVANVIESSILLCLWCIILQIWIHCIFFFFWYLQHQLFGQEKTFKRPMIELKPTELCIKALRQRG